MEDDFMYLPAPLSVENELNLEEVMNAQQSSRQYETTPINRWTQKLSNTYQTSHRTGRLL